MLVYLDKQKNILLWRNIVKFRRKKSDLVLYRLVKLISFQNFNTKFQLKSCPKSTPYMLTIKEEARPNSLKTW